MRILFVETSEEEQEILKSEFAGEDLVFVSNSELDNLSEEQKEAEVISVFVSGECPGEFINSMPSLGLIATRSTGYDHIDLEACKEKGVLVANVPTYGSRTVAEYAFGLILSLSRKVHAAYDRLKEEGTTDVEYFEGFNLEGKTLGVVGTGNIGRNVIRIAKGFDMKVVAFDAYPNEEYAKELDFEYKSLDEVLKESDIVTLHVPYLESTHHLINEEKLALMKKSAYLINTARGEVVDTKALVNALEAGEIAGAGLDVLEEEKLLTEELELLTDKIHSINEFQTLLADHKLIDMEQVIVTPHIAFNTKEAKKEILDTTMANIKQFLEGVEIKNLVKNE